MGRMLARVATPDSPPLGRSPSLCPAEHTTPPGILLSVARFYLDPQVTQPYTPIVRVYREDIGSTGVPTKTPSGGLRIPGTIARTGVLFYSDGTRSWGELVTPEELFHPDSMATLAGATVTDKHPTAGMVTPETYQALNVGHVGDNVRANGSLLDADVLVNAAGELALVQSGERRELSPGYVCEVEASPGVFAGQHYDGIQRKREYNHVALLPPGTARAGAVASLRMDGAAVQVHTTNSGAQVKTFKFRGKEYKLDADGDVASLEEGVAALETEMSNLGPANAAAAKKIEELETKCLALLAKIQAFEAQITAEPAATEAASVPAVDNAKITPEMVPPAVQDSICNARLALIDRAETLGIKRADCQGKTVRSIMELAIAKSGAPSFRLDSKRTDVEIAAAFDVLQPVAENSFIAQAHRDALGIDHRTGQPSVTTDENDADARAEKRHQENLNAWRNPIPGAMTRQNGRS